LRFTGPKGPLLIDIVVERKRNADGVCPCGFHVSGNEETNVYAFIKYKEIDSYYRKIVATFPRQFFKQ
jgi:hypothetical protein